MIDNVIDCSRGGGRGRRRRGIVWPADVVRWWRAREARPEELRARARTAGERRAPFARVDKFCAAPKVCLACLRFARASLQ